MSVTTLSVLRRSKTLEPLSDRELEPLVTGARRVEIARERTVAAENISWPYVALVETGFVQAVLSDPSGREYALFDVTPGEIVADLPLLDGGATALRFVAASTGTRVILLRRNAVLEAAAASSLFHTALSHLVATNMRRVLDRFADHMARPATSRVCAVLLKYSDAASDIASAYPSLSEMTQTQIAREAGTVREIVQRVLTELEAERIIRRERGRVIWTDRQALSTRAATIRQ